LILDSICLSYTGIYMYNQSNQWTGNEHDVYHTEESCPSPPCCRFCRWRCIKFDAMFPYAQQSSINTISDRSFHASSWCALVAEVSCCLFISSRHLVAMQNLNESAAAWRHLWWWDPWKTWLHEIAGK
jgi:hypothetical protein